MTVAMQFGTLVADPQLGAPGTDGRGNAGLAVRFDPKENPLPYWEI
jgi:hypothetical protein